MVKQQTSLVILWYNPKICSIKQYKVLLEKSESSVSAFLPHTTTLFEQGEWLIIDINQIIKYSKIEEENQPQTPGYEIYNIQLITESI